MVRNEETLEASTYAERLPEDLSGRQCYVLDPMLATGGTLAAAIRFLTDRGADDIIASACSSRPRGCANLEAGLEGLDVPVTVVTAALDERLNEKGYIVPGLGTPATGCTASRTDPDWRERDQRHLRPCRHDGAVRVGSRTVQPPPRRQLCASASPASPDREKPSWPPPPSRPLSSSRSAMTSASSPAPAWPPTRPTRPSPRPASGSPTPTRCGPATS